MPENLFAPPLFLTQLTQLTFPVSLSSALLCSPPSLCLLNDTVKFLGRLSLSLSPSSLKSKKSLEPPSPKKKKLLPFRLISPFFPPPSFPFHDSNEHELCICVSDFAVWSLFAPARFFCPGALSLPPQNSSTLNLTSSPLLLPHNNPQLTQPPSFYSYSDDAKIYPGSSHVRLVPCFPRTFLDLPLPRRTWIESGLRTRTRVVDRDRVVVESYVAHIPPALWESFVPPP